eukprot:Opistho-2@70731
MAGKEDVILDPELELAFRRPFDETAQSKLRLSNPSDKAMYFKVKTTAPKRYCVRPNAGKVDRNSSVDVTVFLPKADDLGNDLKCKDKFLVQCVFSSDDNADQETLWKNAATSAPSSIREHKLKCAFLPPVGEGLSESAASPASPAPSSSAPLSVNVQGPVVSPVSSATVAHAHTKDEAAPTRQSVRFEDDSPAAKAVSETKEKEATKSSASAAPKSELRQRVPSQASTAQPSSSHSVAAGDRLAMSHSSQTDARFTALHVVIAFLLGFVLGRFVL